MRLRCRFGIHRWEWTRGVSHSCGSSLNGRCLCCPKTRFLSYRNWGDPKQKKALPQFPITPSAGPPPPPPRSGTSTFLKERIGVDLFPWQREFLEQWIAATDRGESPRILLYQGRSGGRRYVERMVAEFEVLLQHCAVYRDGRPSVCADCLEDWPCSTIRALAEK